MCAWAHRLASYALTGGSRFLSLAYSCTLNSPVFPFAKHPIIQSLRLVRFIFLLPFHSFHLKLESHCERVSRSFLFGGQERRSHALMHMYTCGLFRRFAKQQKIKRQQWAGPAVFFFLWSMRPEADLCASLLDDLVPLHSTTFTRFYSAFGCSARSSPNLYLPAVWNSAWSNHATVS